MCAFHIGLFLVCCLCQYGHVFLKLGFERDISTQIPQVLASDTALTRFSSTFFPRLEFFPKDKLMFGSWLFQKVLVVI